MNSDAKLIIGVVVGSLLLLVLAVVGFGKLNQQANESGSGVKQIQGEERLVRGSEESKVTIVEFSDFQCPACRAAEPLVKRILEKGGVKLVYRHMPLSSIHKNAQLAAEAAEAANAQGKFWEYHDLLFQRQQEWEGEKSPEGKFIEYAGELGLNADEFTKALAERSYRDLVISDYQEALRLGVNATPTFFVNGRRASTVDLEKMVEEELGK